MNCDASHEYDLKSSRVVLQRLNAAQPSQHGLVSRHPGLQAFHTRLHKIPDQTRFTVFCDTNYRDVYPKRNYDCPAITSTKSYLPSFLLSFIDSIFLSSYFHFSSLHSVDVNDFFTLCVFFYLLLAMYMLSWNIWFQCVEAIRIVIALINLTNNESDIYIPQIPQ